MIENTQHGTHSSLTSEPLISSIRPSARMRRLADSVTILPFLYQVMVGGGTALDSHSRLTDSPTSTFTTTGESPLLSRILGGTEGSQERRKHLPSGQSQALGVQNTQCGCGLTENSEVDVFVSLSCCVHGHTAVLSPIRYFCFQNL